MSPTFDPYHVWLGISPAEQPPTAYRLLGLSLFESNSEVIDNAAQRVAMHLRELARGVNASVAEQLLAQVEAAQVTLLDPHFKAAYDQALYDQMRAASSPVPAQPAAAPVVVHVPLPEMAAAVPVVHVPMTAEMQPAAPVPARSAPQAPRRSRQQANQAEMIPQSVKIVLGGMIGVLLGYFVVYFVVGRDPLGLLPDRKPPAKQPARAAPLDP